jgi:hypothetical protein
MRGATREQMSLDGRVMRHHFAVDRTQLLQRSRLMRFPRYCAPLVALSLMAACGNPRTEANVAQALNDAALEISALKNDMAQLSTEIDSLRTALIKQDSTLSRIAAVNNIPVSR